MQILAPVGCVNLFISQIGEARTHTAIAGVMSPLRQYRPYMSGSTLKLTQSRYGKAGPFFRLTD